FGRAEAAGVRRHQRNGVGSRPCLRRAHPGLRRAGRLKLVLLQELQRDIAAEHPSPTVPQLPRSRHALVTAAEMPGDHVLSADQLTEVRKRIGADRSGVIEDAQLFVRVYSPSPRMVIVGAVHIAQALAPMAKLAGFDVTVIDPREAFARSSQLTGINSIVA